MKFHVLSDEEKQVDMMHLSAMEKRVRPHFQGLDQWLQ